MEEELFYCERPFVLINDKGEYFDEFNDIKNILKYPEYSEINIDEVKQDKKVVYLYPHQKKEIELLKVYFPVFKTPVMMDKIIGKFIDGENIYDEKKILKLVENNRYYWLSLFIFGRIHEKYNLNPSYFRKNLNFWKAYDLDVKEPIFFLELMAEHFLGETPQSKVIKKLVNIPKSKKIKIDSIEWPDDFFELLSKEGLIYQPTTHTFARL